MRAARITVSNELLAEWMALPDESRIWRVSDASVNALGLFEVLVEHPSLEEVPDGAEVPFVDYTVTREVIEGTFHQ